MRGEAEHDLASSSATPELGAGDPIFAAAASDYLSRGLSVIPCADKRPRIRGYRRYETTPPSPATVAEWARKYPNDNLAILAGTASSIMVVDCDDPDVVNDMLTRCGDTPVKVASPRENGGIHLWYRYNGERSRNGLDGAAVDIKAPPSAVVISPPSIRPGTGRAYRFIEGDLEELERLPTVKPGSLPQQHERRDIEGVGEGKRNEWFYKELAPWAHKAGTFNELLMVAQNLNERCDPPLSETEAVRIAESRWQQKEEGRLMLPGKQYVPPLEIDKLKALSDRPEAFTLHQYLMAHHWRRRQVFAIDQEKVAAALGWSEYTIRGAIKELMDRGFLVRIHHGGKGPGDPHQYAFGPAAQ